MDLSKNTLQDLDANKSDKFINENKKQDDSGSSQINYESLPEKICNSDFQTFSNYSEVDSTDEKQNTNHLNYKQLKIMNIQNSQSKSDNAAERSIPITSNINDLPNLKGTISVNQNAIVEQISIFEDESGLSSKLNRCDKTIITDESTNGNILNAAEISVFPEKTDKPGEETLEFQEELKKTEVAAEEVETIEKVAEMTATSDQDMVESKPKTKKQLQLLGIRNQNLQSCNSLDDNSTSVSNVEPNIRPLQTNADETDYKIKPISDQRSKKRKHVSDSPKKLQIGTPKIKSNEMSEENLLEKSRFEEIENKLEEMFAGIEDEKLVNTAPDDKNLPKKSDDSLEKYLKVDCISTNADYNTGPLLKDDGLKYDNSILNKSSLPTKAAKKSTTSPLCDAENTKQLNSLFSDHKSPSIPKSLFYLKTVPPRRRLSIGLNKELLKHSEKNKDEIIEKKVANSMREEGKSPPLTNLPNHREAKQIRKNVLTNKIKNNNEKNHSKYKKELTDVNANNCSNKKIIRKSEASIKTTQSRQKIKQPRIFSENDTEEKQLQTREETKNRSPYILIKSNGNIAVVNTVTPDDYNEKFTRSKKFSNCAYERKTVKGCHSSTLSNRYDADTADSSWKCVFCKIGPHKKGLGDLFGPYIISSDCDEYRSIKDTLENFQKLRRNDSQLLNFSNKSVKFTSETSNSHIRNISDCNYEHLINIYALGMSQVSVDCYEIWVHEECAIWAPNIFVVGSRLAGLEEATWNSVRHECVYCLKQGALLCCLQRDCKTTSHVPCAREFKWLLNESKFWAYCSKHALQKHLNKT